MYTNDCTYYVKMVFCIKLYSVKRQKALPGVTAFIVMLVIW